MIFRYFTFSYTHCSTYNKAFQSNFVSAIIYRSLYKAQKIRPRSKYTPKEERKLINMALGSLQSVKKIHCLQLTKQMQEYFLV